MESRIATLDVRIRGGPGVARGLELAAEQLSVEVLRRCDALLEQRHPGRIWIARELALSIRVGNGAFRDGAEVDAVAHALADSIEQAGSGVGVDRSAAGEVAGFSDEAAWRVAHLEWYAHERGAPDWAFASLGSIDEAVHALVSGDAREALPNVILALHQRSTLDSVTAALPEHLTIAIAEALGMPRSSPRNGVDSPDARHDPSAASPVTSAPTTGEEASAWIAATAASLAHRHIAGTSITRHDVVRADESLRRASHLTPDLRTAHGDALVDAASRAEHPQAREGIATEFGGVFFLLSLALEGHCGEALWHACLPEGYLLAQAIAVLLGVAGETDPAPRVFGGVDPWSAPPDVSAEQQAEVSPALCASFIDLVARRGLAHVPAPLLRLTGQPPDRLLVASGVASPFVWFAAPGNTRDEVQRAIDGFFAVFAASNPRACGEPALAEFDRRARLRPLDCATPDPLVPSMPSLHRRALVAQLAGMLAYAFAARVGCPDIAIGDLRSRYLSIPARVVTAADLIEVILPSERLDIDVRRAALDTDPGWVPWLKRRVIVLYEDTSDLAI